MSTSATGPRAFPSRSSPLRLPDDEGSIPIFWCSGDSTDVYDPSGALVASLEAPPTHGVYSVLDALGDDDLALQQRLIRFAFDSETTLSLQSPRRMRYERGLQTPAHSAYEGAKDLYRQYASLRSAPSRTALSTG